MPPKKDNKKQAQSKPDNSGIPKQDVEFKFSFSFKSDASQLPAYVIMFEWFGSISDKIERFDTSLLETWKKDQNSYSFEKQCDLIRVDDDFCKTLTSKKFYIYFVNAQDNKVQESLLFDYSSLLMAKGQTIQFSFESNTIRILNIDSFSLKVTADKELLQQTYRHYLNPFEVEVIGAKDVPIETSSKYQPTYIKYTFFDGSVVQTNSIVGNDKLLWSHKHVFLVGLMNSVEFKEKIRSNYLKFQLHDRDQIHNKKLKPDVGLYDVTKAIMEELQKQKPIIEDPKKKDAKKQQKKDVKKDSKKDPKKKDAKLGEPILPEKIDYLKNNYGVSAYYLVDFLKPSMKTARYKAPVVPKNTFQDFQSKNIDLNTTARNEMQKIISSNNYFDRDTVLVVGFTLSYPVGTFIKPEAKDEVVVEDPKKKKDGKQVEAIIQKKIQNEIKPANKDVFERLVYIIPYNDKDSINTIQNLFYQANLAAFKLKNKRELTTYLLTKEDKSSITINYVTGLEIIDPEARIYILQGLKTGAIQSFNNKIIKIAPNSKNYKIFKNSNLTFSQRLFADFNIELKRIRLRPSLSQILLDPSIYIKSKVAEEICQNLNKLVDIRKICDDLATVDSMNLWPSAQWLIQIERKYSQSLSIEDITGEEDTKFKKKERKNQSVEPIKTIRFMENTEVKYFTADEFFLPKIQQAQGTNNLGDINLSDIKKRMILTKTFTKDENKLVQTFNMKGKRAQIPVNQPVYIYGGQKNNFYEKQMKQLREQIQTHPNLIYTYSKDYMRLSIDPKNTEDQFKKDKELNLTKMYAKEVFNSLLIRTKDEKMKLPKRPTDQDIKAMKENPYHQQKFRQKILKTNTRDLPLNSGKDQFVKYLKKKDIFGEYEVLEGEKMTLVQKQLLERQQKKKLEEQQKHKVLGGSEMKIKKGYVSDKAAGIDRFKDIREGSPNKIGIIDVHKRTKEKRPIQDYEVSLFQKESIIDPSFNPLVRKDNSNLNMEKDQFNFYQRPEVLTNTKIFKPLKETL